MSRFLSERHKALVPYTPGEQPRERKYIKLNTNESPFPPSAISLKMIEDASKHLNLYSDPTCKSLIDEACAILGVDNDEIIFTNGSDDILNFAMLAFCDEKHPVVFPDITYGFYSVFATLNHVPYVEIKLTENLEVDISDYKGIGKNIFIANPNAPTGRALSRADVEQIIASNPGNIVLVDEAYVDFGGESCVGLIKKYNNLIVTRTFSKSRSLAGARLGFGVACPELIRDLNTIRYSTNPYNINSMTMAAGIGALRDTDYFNDCIVKIKENREFTQTELKKLGFEMPDSKANFLFVRNEKVSGLELYMKLREKGILVRHFETPRLKEFNRITIGSKDQMIELITAIKEILGERK